MRSVAEHLGVLLSGVEPLSSLEVRLAEARGCVLAESVIVDTPVPAVAQALVVGYAVRTDDTLATGGARPIELDVIADLVAGDTPASPLAAGQAVRVGVGAPVPDGADAVLPTVATNGGTRVVTVRSPAIRGANIRPIGADVCAGEEVLSAGIVLGPRHISVLGHVGRGRVAIHPRPRVVVITIGDELVEPGAAAEPGQISDTNGPALAAAAWDAGAVTYRVGPLPRDAELVRRTVEDQLVRADLVITTGGVSADAYDTVKEVLGRIGDVEFSMVSMTPGAAQGFGSLGDERTPIFTLPGNPYSAYVSFEVFVRPYIRRLAGHPVTERPMVGALCRGDVANPDGVTRYLRADLGVVDGAYAVTPLAEDGSVRALAMANALIVLPAEVDQVKAGEYVRVMRLTGQD